MYYLGIDHHKRFSQVAVMDEQGKAHINCRMVNEKVSFEILKRRLNNHESLRAVIEAGRNWGMMYDLLVQYLPSIAGYPDNVEVLCTVCTNFLSFTPLLYQRTEDAGNYSHPPPLQVGSSR